MITLLLVLVFLNGLFNLGVMLILALYFQNKLREIRKLMNEQEQALDAGIQGLKDAVTAATQRVLNKIAEVSANNPDLSDELQEVTDLTKAVNDILAAPAPPTGGDTGTGTGDTPPATGDGTGTGDNPPATGETPPATEGEPGGGFGG